MALPTLKIEMVDKHPKTWKNLLLPTLLMGCIALQACESSKRADQVLYVCFDRSGSTGEAIDHLRNISDRFKYHFSEYGAQAKSDLEIIDANPKVIPEGKPIQAEIRNGDGDVVAIASNFGSNGEDLRVSFFYGRYEDQRSPFPQAVLSSLEAINGSQLDLSVETEANPCGEK
jgi:hypothetical protein